MYKAKRAAIGIYEIEQSSGARVVRIEMPKKVWATDNAPLNNIVGALGMNDCPIFEFPDARHEVRRGLLTNNMLVNRYNIWIDQGDTRIIEAYPESNVKPVRITYRGEEFRLVRTSWFKYAFTLERNGQPLAQFEDTTPFLTFTAARSFNIKNRTEIDDMLVGFAFFLTALIYFKG